MNAAEQRAVDRAARNERVPFDFWIVQVNYVRYCNAFDVEQDGVVGLGWYYLVDMNRHVHTCSLTPSAEMWPMVEYAWFKDETSDETHEAWEDGLRRDEEPCSYFDFGSIRGLPKAPLSRFMDLPEREEYEDCEAHYLRIVEAAREQLCANHPGDLPRGVTR